tara:strand:- start:6 stop:626 length:621 start_codon:yes stop_codon:yes gene_type:complete
MPYTPACVSSVPTRRSECSPRAELVALLVDEMRLSNAEIADVISSLTQTLRERQRPNSTDESYDLSAQPDMSESESDSDSDVDSDDDMPGLISASEEDDDYDEEEDEGEAAGDDDDDDDDDDDENESNEIHNVHPSTLVLVRGVATFLKDIEDDDIDRMTNEELRVYNQYIRRYEDDTDIESGDDIFEDMLLSRERLSRLQFLEHR